MIHASAALILANLLPGSTRALPPVPLADVFVDASADCAAGTGSAGTPVCTIAAALALAASGDTIRIAPGTYVENLVVGVDLDLIGTGGASVTTIDGGAQGSVVTIPNAVTVTLDGLTLTGGLALVGGAINCSGNLTLSNSTLSDNLATGPLGGGAIGSTYGGADVSIVNCTIERNQATRGAGGAVSSRSGPLQIVSSLLRENTAQYYGGAVYFDDGDTGYALEIEDTWISGNEVVDGYGGGLSLEAGWMTLTNSTLSGNTSTFGGGGIDSERASFDIRNSTISGNTSGYGGGMNVFGSFIPTSLSLSLSNVTITNNESLTVTGGGIQNSSGYSLEFTNSIIAQNITPPGYSFGRDLSGQFVTLGHNLVGAGAFGVVDGVNGDRAGDPSTPLDAGLAPLISFGGNPAVHALLPGSAALDQGDPANFEAFDQLGRMRPRGIAPDIGAIEGEQGIDFCFGDGGDGAGCTPCPCGNEAPLGTIGGCLNSNGTSMRLLRSGTSSVSQPNLRFDGAGALPLSTALLISSSTAAPSNPANPCFGLDTGVQSLTLDGLRCAVAGISRHGARATDVSGETVSGWGLSDSFPGFLAFVAGETRGFQLIAREDPAQGCQTGLNTSQGSRVTFAP